MTSKVTIEAQSHDAIIRELPVINGRPLDWERLSEETRKFGEHRVPKGETREMVVHCNRALLVLEAPEPFELTILKGGGETFLFFPTEADRKQCQINHGQSLERLNERGGLTWDELLAVLGHRPWGAVDKDIAREQCQQRRAA